MKKNNNLLKKTNKQKVNTTWIITIIVLAFCISVFFSFISETTLKNTNIIIGIVVLLIFIVIGITFDMIGVSVTTADEAPFHSMAARKVKGAKTAIYLKRNAAKVSSFCCDVVGDICGIISGSAGVAIASSITNSFNIDTLIIGLIITGITASLTIGGKAIFKSVAINNSNVILNRFAKLISILKKEK